MNTDGIRGFWLHALASLCIVYGSQECKFTTQYRVKNSKMELYIRYGGLYDRIYGPSGHVICYQWSILSAIGMTVNGAKTWQNQTQSLQSAPALVERGHTVCPVRLTTGTIRVQMIVDCRV